MNRLPIRLRLTLFFTLAMAIVVSAMGIFLYARVSSDLDRTLNLELRSRAQDLSALVLRGGSLRQTGSPFIEHGETFAEVVTTGGRVLDATPSLGSTVLLSRSQLRRAEAKPIIIDRRSAPGLDEPARMLAVPLDVEGRQAVLVVGATRENRAETLASLRRAFLIGGPIALLLASLGGYLLSGAALRPIEAMRRRAAEISTSSLDDRLPVSEASDEVARLGRTLNEMLARIEDGVARERRFVADASHELRTPLAMLKAELELALRRSRSPEELERAIRSAAQETDRLSLIADDLLLLARAEQGRLEIEAEPTDIGDVLQAVSSRFAARAESEGRSLAVEGGAAVANLDRLRIEQALGNVVDNAFRHGAGPITLTAVVRDSTVELHVLDEGQGFPADFREIAFERFSRAAAPGSAGSGLGLAIVETIARAHGGDVEASNRPGSGADVRITLPL